ncbi:Regulator of chromosome condensation 1/beta-lactamase-inhibitor protein II [Pseudocohnilembus persalinus]|uniref:Regulator of chromosome condensation 1/beta-lactamase-inhibitor protein II n=1 Tax=Pseudocohnilembus persalinus TaxID=266149 RepID=A0A0V0QKQ9_PSEPJ|nr:Regulator of chromosome condensation 1/beta-lactamase-inhibitor protein II [Pseudocohnilembus persalinus]|eukprot:KRX02730.1 Regulator of chromosome condensation 1/beta-lactamase-inhibitor protein II [Pseudocohnilembus persalinus]
MNSKSNSEISHIEESKQDLNCFVFCWGKNLNAELSLPKSITKVFTPKHPKGLNNLAINQISSGAEHSAVITINGKLLISGSYLHNKLGIPDLQMTHIQKFQQIPELENKYVTQVACGDYHTICLTEEGKVFAWGGSLKKKLGGTRLGKPAPVKHLEHEKIIQINCGDFHSTALTETGRVYTWGGGGEGQLGHGHLKDLEYPQVIKALAHKKIIQISCGQYHTMALSDDNQVYGWGKSMQGECGFGEYINANEPKMVNIKLMKSKNFINENPEKIVKVIAGGKHTLFLSNLGQVYSCGQGSHGQLGQRKPEKNSMEPKLIYGFQGKKVIDIAAGQNHSMLITDIGDVYTCGYGANGQLGHNSEESKTVFTHIMSLGGYKIKGIFAGGDHSWVVIDDGQPYIEDYQPPSPLKLNETKFPDYSNDNTLNKSADNLSKSPQNTKKTQKNLQQQQQILSEKMLQLVYSDVEDCHRFVRFQLKDGKTLDDVQNQCNKYLKEQHNIEQGIKYIRLKNDVELITEKQANIFNQTQDQKIDKQSLQKSFTFMYICDPLKNEDTNQLYEQKLQNNQENQTQNQNNQNNQNQKQQNNILKQTCIGDMTIIREKDLLNDQLEQKLSGWFINFSEKFKDLTQTQKFFELRPQYYQQLNQNHSQYSNSNEQDSEVI